MRLSALIFTSLLAVSKLVQASPPVPRARDSSLSGLLSYLNGKGLTSLSNALNDAAKADGGNKITDALNSGQVTILAPNNDAFNSFKPSSDILDILLYHIVYGNIDTGFRTPDSLSRRLPLQNRNTGTSAYVTNGLKTSARKRSSSFEDNQVQIIDQFVTASRKRWAPTSTIFINEAVGDAKVLERSSFKNIDIFTIGTVLAIPTAVSDLLCKPLIESAPGGFPKFGGSLQKAGLLDTVDNGKRITIFAPTDEAFDNIDLKDYSNNDLASLLKNHFSFGKVIYSPLFPTTPEITAESGNKIEITVVNGVQYVQCGHSRAQLRRSDVIASNGVMHVIDAVLKCD